jgi:hypothetical protein
MFRQIERGVKKDGSVQVNQVKFSKDGKLFFRAVYAGVEVGMLPLLQRRSPTNTVGSII